MDEARIRDVLFRGILSEIREGHDHEWCKKHIVKRARRLLKPPMDANQLSPEVEKVRAEFAASLDKFCQRCTREDCKGKRPGREAV